MFKEFFVSRAQQLGPLNEKAIAYLTPNAAVLG